MNESSYDQNTQIAEEEVGQKATTSLPENNAYYKLRRTALISTIVLILLILITLLYLNGKSLYEHGL